MKKKYYYSIEEIRREFYPNMIFLLSLDKSEIISFR